MTYPPDFTVPQHKVVTAYAAAEAIAHLAPAHGVVVQAGGCAGLWPLALARHFARVYTFEPAPSNFSCLQRNIAEAHNISACPLALGDTRRRVGLTRPKVGAGLWRVEGDGEIPMDTLDDVLGDVAIDALVLDVEGGELQAWQGAARLITTHHPLLWFEYLDDRPEMNAFLAVHGYTPPLHGLGGDAYSRYSGDAGVTR